ncbi:MAG: TerD family protein [Treponema sp.]|jgi:stress response protein SCP2|nr:TerD family protein [Treponema sp.]
MSINLTKGQRVDLSKDDGGALRKVVAGLGWDVADNGPDIDCDASAILCGANGKTIRAGDVVFYNQPKHPSGSVYSTGDNLTGEGEGDDEQLIVDLAKVPSEYEKIVFVVTIYQAKERNQHFGLINNAFIRIVDAETNKEIMKYNLSENYPGKTGMIFGEIYRKDGKWKFNAIGQATDDGGITSMSARFGYTNFK